MTIATNKLLILAASGLLVTLGAPSSARADEGDDDDDVDVDIDVDACDDDDDDDSNDCEDDDDDDNGCTIAADAGGVGGLLLGLGLVGWHVRPRRRG